MDAADAGRVGRARSWLRPPLARVALLLGVAGGIAAWVVCDPLGTDTTARPDSQPTKAELVALLEGQTVSAAAGEQPSRAGAGPGTLTLRRIEALEIEGTTSVDSKTWSTEVSFLALAKTGRNAAGRYAVAGTVRHRLIEGKRAFLGFQAKAVVKQ